MTNDDGLVEQIKRNYREADIDATTMMMLKYVEKVTLRAYEATENDVKSLRQAGFTDEDILDIVHITGFFSHINRIADALGVDLEDFMPSK